MNENRASNDENNILKVLKTLIVNGDLTVYKSILKNVT